MNTDRNILQNSQNNEEFTLNQLRFSSFGIYGRRDEFIQMHKSLNEIRVDNTSRESKKKILVLISGQSGTGKTTLAKQLHDPVINIGGFFVSGKFDSQKISDPYSAFSKAFNQLCDSILDLKEKNVALFEKIKNSVREAIDSEGESLYPIVPHLKTILQKQKQKQEDDDHKHHEHKFQKHDPESIIVGPKSKIKFNFLMRNFVRAVCSPSFPLVLMIDDLQWADAASLDLMENLMTDEENSGLLFIGCYRNNEIKNEKANSISSRIHDMERKIIEKEKSEDSDKSDNTIKKSSTSIVKMTLGNLSIKVINDILEDLLSSNKSKTEYLAQVVHKKTQGNTFFVIEFLKSLKDRGMLTYNMGLMKWEWDEEEIRSKMNVTENVAELMRDKMEKALSDEVKEVLFIAACLGFTFEASTLALVVSKMKKKKFFRRGYLDDDDDTFSMDLVRSLNLCVEENLLECKHENREGESSLLYWFIHDQIQHAALSLFSKNERELLQFRIGEILIGHFSESSLEKNLFIAVNLLNRGMDRVLCGDDNLVKLARLNLQAAEKALKASAFIPSGTYSTKGIQILRQIKSSNEEEVSKLSFNLHCIAAQAEYCNGNFVVMHSHLEKILLKKSKKEVLTVEKLFPYLTLLDALVAQERNLEVIETSIFVLSMIGIHFPKKNLKFHIVKKLVKTKMLLRGKSIKNLVSELPTLTNDFLIMAMKIIQLMSSSTYVMNPDLMALSTLMGVVWSLRYGVCQCTPAMFGVYGLVLCAMGDIKSGYEFGKLSIGLLDRLDLKYSTPAIYFIFHTFISHWMDPLPLSVKPLEEGYQVGMKIGDIKHGILCLYASMWCNLNRGQRLDLVEEGTRKVLKEAKDFNQDVVMTSTPLLLQFVLNLSGKAHDPIILTGEAMNENDMLMEYEKINNFLMIDIIKVYQMMLACYFGKYELAWKRAKEAKTFERTNASSQYISRKLFFQGVTAFSLAHHNKSKNRSRFRRHYVRCGVKVLRKLKKWVSFGNVNCIHVVCLLEAEAAFIKGEEGKACEKYLISIKMASRAGFVHDKAFANERLGEFYLVNEKNEMASFHLKVAHQLYVEWGARSKADQLVQKYHDCCFDVEYNTPRDPTIK